ncbi:hypothetical protein AAVH_25692 [Aphelenchoides avenae]|nr:hypothetical protein AAVH_25692 [Aphelenchus avenae]
MLQYDALFDVATFLGVFGVEGLLLANQAYARFVSSFIRTRPITNVRTLTVLHVWNMEMLELRFTFFKAPNVATQELIHISQTNVEEALAILLSNTVLNVLVIRSVAPVGQEIENAFRNVANSLAICERLELELDDRLFEGTDELLSFLEAPHKIKASVGYMAT